MKLPQEVTQVLLNAEAKAFATSYNSNINVVPVSSVKIVNNKIWLIDYFFNKTCANIKQNPNVALTFWIGLRGFQIKGETTYLTSGELFNEALNWIAKIHPNRNIKGLVIIEATEIFDVSIHNKRL